MVHMVKAEAVEAGTAIIGSNSANGDYFGSALAATDDYLVVGAPRNDAGGADGGSVYIYERSGGAWAEVVTFAGAASDYMGDSVAVAGDIIAVCSSRFDSYSGKLSIYQRLAGTWTLTQTITNPDAANGLQFGRNLAMNSDGSKMIVGHIGSRLKGCAWVFDFNFSTGQYGAAQDIRPIDLKNGDCFGVSVAMSADGTTYAVGCYKSPTTLAEGDPVAYGTAGAVYVTNSSGTTKIRSPYPGAGQFFGRMVGVTNNVLVASEPISNRLRIYDWNGSAWVSTGAGPQPKTANVSYLFGFQGHQGDGYTLGPCMNNILIKDDRIAVVPSLMCRSYCGATHPGVVWVFDLDNESFRAFGRGTTAATTNCGSAAAVSNGKLLVGFPLATAGNTATSGAVYETATEDWDPSYGSVIPDTTAPTVTLVSPAADGTPIDPKDPIVFEVQDETSLAHVEVRAMQNGVYETVYNGTAIVSPYTGTVTVISPTHLRFSVVRAGAGWVSAVRLSVTPVDHAGNKV